MHRNGMKEEQDKTWVGGKGDQMRIVQKIKIWYTVKWYIHKPESVSVNETHKIVWVFEIQTNHQIASRGSCCIAVIQLYVYIYMRKHNQQ